MASINSRMDEEISKRLKRLLILTSGETRWKTTGQYLVKGNIRTRSNLLNLVKNFPDCYMEILQDRVGQRPMKATRNHIYELTRSLNRKKMQKVGKMNKRPDTKNERVE